MPANPQVTDEMVEKAARILLNRMFAFNTWEAAPSDAKEICKINAKDCLTAALADYVVGWLDIESAPKDGTEIDVWHFCHNPTWRDEHGLASGMRIENVRWADGGWSVFDSNAGELIRIDDSPENYTISHWMPLPASPIVSQEG
jgi:hypothetical protein